MRFLYVALVIGLGCSTDPVDTDGDGISDADELVYGTAVDNADTDGDGLNDPLELQMGTNPLAADTDSDGLDDGEEDAAGLDPLDWDSDMDGFSDGDEVTAATDPLDPFSWPHEGGKWCDRSRAAESVYATGWELEDIAPDVALYDQFGQEMSLHQLYGNVILLDFLPAGARHVGN